VKRRSVILITLMFIGISAALHVLLGGSLRAPWQPAASKTRISVVNFDKFPTPEPKPSPTRTPPPKVTAPRATVAPARQKSTSYRRNVTLPVRKEARPIATTQPQTMPSPPAPAQSAVPLPQAPATPVDARDIIVSARFIHRAEPVYPPFDIDRRVEGTVIVLVTIGPDGSASDVRVWQSSGDMSLDRAALQAAQASTFAPPEVNGQPATQTYRIIYTFYLD